ncbi:phosphotransferase [Paractinoplanes lichenicola]|uniref:Phosphotransferase n=1 Tax=Paractinoplanes lichenicola TaxID=2802976 RepID=A0ABS1VUM9_9ACTN|nr:phosphotransferase [Actinoplanes lichenicola]MBL7258165.1 phosphotransferase [Actinoplanes lichenicola]
MRSDWAALPEAVTTRITDRVGEIHVVPAGTGDHAEIAATVSGPLGSVFVKAAQSDLGVRSLRYELRVGEALQPPCSPAVQWHFETGGWLVAGFEQLDGPHADLSPGSPDLDLLATAIKDLSVAPEPAIPLYNPAARLGFSHPAMAGEALIHTDLNPANLIVTSDGLRIVDWAFTTKAAPWLELAMLVPWLIGSGHTPEQAENWLSQFSAWDSAGSDAMDHFATSSAAKWSAKAQATSPSWIHDLAIWTSRWAQFRA